MLPLRLMNNWTNELQLLEDLLGRPSRGRIERAVATLIVGKSGGPSLRRLALCCTVW